MSRVRSVKFILNDVTEQELNVMKTLNENNIRKSAFLAFAKQNFKNYRKVFDQKQN